MKYLKVLLCCVLFLFAGIYALYLLWPSETNPQEGQERFDNTISSSSDVNKQIENANDSDAYAIPETLDNELPSVNDDNLEICSSAGYLLESIDLSIPMKHISEFMLIEEMLNTLSVSGKNKYYNFLSDRYHASDDENEKHLILYMLARIRTKETYVKLLTLLNDSADVNSKANLVTCLFNAAKVFNYDKYNAYNNSNTFARKYWESALGAVNNEEFFALDLGNDKAASMLQSYVVNELPAEIKLKIIDYLWSESNADIVKYTIGNLIESEYKLKDSTHVGSAEDQEVKQRLSELLSSLVNSDKAENISIYLLSKYGDYFSDANYFQEAISKTVKSDNFNEMNTEAQRLYIEYIINSLEDNKALDIMKYVFETTQDKNIKTLILTQYLASGEEYATSNLRDFLLNIVDSSTNTGIVNSAIGTMTLFPNDDIVINRLNNIIIRDTSEESTVKYALLVLQYVGNSSTLVYLDILSQKGIMLDSVQKTKAAIKGRMTE